MNARERHRLRDASTKADETERAANDEATAVADGLAALLEAHRGERHILVLQSFPDPDAISSALAHQMIAAGFNIECDIAYDGIISHHENVALVELLDITLVRIGEQDNLARYQGSVFIDTQGTTTGLTERLGKAGVPVLAIIDHHELQGVIKAEFTDIRDIGATATIYTQYLESGLLKLERSDPGHVRLATALMHGIRSETAGLLSALREDFMAAAYLAEYVDQAVLADILAVTRSRKVMNIIKTALENRTVHDNYSVAGIGYLRYEDRDAIPQAADFLLTEENVHTAIVYGMLEKPGGGEAIIGSLRTKKATLNPDAFLKDALGGLEPGRYYGGGRREAGGFEIPIGFLAGSSDEDFRRRKWRLYDEQIKRKLWAKLGIQIVQQSNGE
ncbi:MAG TPA: bifunctional oligoribonuclease/PAP phosphatase NrnA [Pyrinomonadaceae bacterium]|nr:bifunctional oligoribonuclease/PAP phosphatase NrnA [Pyrinomonadaceae bacterium]